jgi:hypothetical protein
VRRFPNPGNAEGEIEVREVYEVARVGLCARRILAVYFRYTADGSLISETRSVGIRIYKNGQWGSAGGLGQVTHHDRSNSVA